jgi:hypothetical protein
MSINWDGRVETGRCQYCGHDYKGEECPGCAARRRERVVVTGVATAKVRALANPNNAWLMSLPRLVEIHYLECGAPDIYSNWDMVIQFQDCETVSKEIINPSSISEDEMTWFAVRFKGNVVIQWSNPAYESRPI